MSAVALRREEKDLGRIVDAIAGLQQGRSNAHGTVELTDNGVATSTAVSDASTCSSASHVSITPTNSNAAALTGVYVVAANKSFTIHHPATAVSCTFTWAIQG